MGTDAPDIYSVVLLGVIEGITEFIPVSSTGHLILAGDLLNLHGDKIKTFEIFIQLGAILSVLVLYWRRFAALLDFRCAREGEFNGWHGLVKLGVCALPVFIVGPLVHDYIKRVLFVPLPVALALVVGGIAIVALDREQKNVRSRSLEDISLSQALLIGVFQCLSLWPGISRSGSTIIGAMLVGLERKVAAEFSFLVAVPVMSAAVAYELLKNMSVLNGADVQLFLTGFVVSFFTAIAAIKFFVGIVSRFSMRPFGYYRIILGLAVVLGVYLK